MSDANFVQTSFLGGEWAPFAQGRTDLPTYKEGMNTCLNGLPLEEGCWVRRSGTQQLATTLNGKPGRVIKFETEEILPYLVEFTDGAMRFYTVNTVGPTDFTLMNDGTVDIVASLSSTNPCQLTFDTNYGWVTGDQIYFTFGAGVPNSYAVPLQNRTFQLSTANGTLYTLIDPLTGGTIDGTSFQALPSTGSVTASRVLKLTSEYVSQQWQNVVPIQAETEMILLHPLYAPSILTLEETSQLVDAAESGGYGLVNHHMNRPGSDPVVVVYPSDAAPIFNIGAAQFTDGPYLDFPLTTTLTPSALSGTIELTASQEGEINSGQGFLQTDLGRCIRLFSQPPNYAVGTAYTVGQNVTYNGAYFTCIQAGTGQEPDVAVAYWTINPSAAVWTWGTIESVLTVASVTVLIEGTALLHDTANCIVTWALGVYSNTTGWPSCGVYYEGRLWLAGAVANRVDASQTNDLFNFAPTLVDGTVTDDCGIAYIFNASDVNPIFWMIGTQTGIVCGTQGGEWVIQATTAADPLTPTNIQAHRVTTYGCANIQPEHTELTISFVHRYQRKVLEYFPDVFSGRYTAPNLSKLAKHLTRSGIVEIKYQRELAPVLWARCTNGSLIGATYKRTSLFSSQGPEFVAWHKHTLGSGRLVTSITVGPSADGELDCLAMVTQDQTTGLNYVELMQNIFEDEDDIKSGWFLDGAIVPSGGAVTNLFGVGALTLNGLWYLNGQTVTVWVGGVDVGDFEVANGSVSVPIDDDIDADLTSLYLESISELGGYGIPETQISAAVGKNVYSVPCLVGYTYTSQGQTLRPDSIDQMRSPTGPGLGKPRRIHQFGALLASAAKVSFGPDFESLHAANFMSPGGSVPLDDFELFSGVYWDTLDDDSSFDGMLAWQINRPYPCALMSIGGFLNSEDR